MIKLDLGICDPYWQSRINRTFYFLTFNGYSQHSLQFSGVLGEGASCAYTGPAETGNKWMVSIKCCAAKQLTVKGTLTTVTYGFIEEICG